MTATMVLYPLIYGLFPTNNRPIDNSQLILCHVARIYKKYGKNDFAEVSKNLIRYRFENNCGPLK